MTNKSTARRQSFVRLLDGDVVLTADDIIDLGLEEAPENSGPSWQEIADAKSRGRDHG